MTRDIEKMRHDVYQVFSDPFDCSIESLSSACRYCGTDDDCINSLNKIEDLGLSYKKLLELSLIGFGDADTEGTADLRRSRLALRVLINACNRYDKLKSAVTSECVNFYRVLLRIPDLNQEVLASLLSVSLELHKACALHSEYPTLLGEMVSLWEKSGGCSWLSAHFSHLLENDYAFLANCFADFKPEEFTILLRIAETLLDKSETDLEIKVHSNNIQFCVDFLERVLYDLSENEISVERRSQLIEQITYTVDIIGNCALRGEQYSNELLSKSTGVALIVDMLESVLDAQAVAELRDDSENPPRKAYPDRPDRQKSARMPRAQSKKQLRALSEYIQEVNSELRGTLKFSLVRAIGNLCFESSVNKLEAGERGAVILVLSCARVTKGDKPFITQWCIGAIRHLCAGCIENQNVILSIDQAPTGIIDRDRLFRELGLELDKDPVSGKLTIRKPRPSSS